MTGGSLRKELKKRAAFDSPQQEALLNVLRTSDLFDNRLGRLLRDYGLTPSQYNVLRILRGEGAPLPSLAIAERLIQVVPAITGLIDRLEAQGLVARKRSSDDRRVVYVQITPQATAMLKKIDGPLDALHRGLLAGLTRNECKQLSRLLEKARAGVNDAEK